MKLDGDFLAEVGLAEMPEQERVAFLQCVAEELELRIGQKISDGLTDRQVEEFAGIKEKAVAEEWLKRNKPDYPFVAKAVLEDLKAEIVNNRARILAWFTGRVAIEEAFFRHGPTVGRLELIDGEILSILAENRERGGGAGDVGF